MISCAVVSHDENSNLDSKPNTVEMASLLFEGIDSSGPGVNVMAIYDGEIILEKSIGYADVENKIPLDRYSKMRMASVSKQFTALAVLSMIEEGRLNLSDELFDYLPYDICKGILIKHLLNHTSGIASFDEYFENNWDKNKIIQNKDIMKWLSSNPKPLFEPGTDFAYSNTAYIVLASLVEHLSGQDYQRYTKVNVFQPLGMDASYFLNIAYKNRENPQSICYKGGKDNWQNMDDFYMNGIMGDGAVYTSMHEYAKMDSVLRNDSTFLKNTRHLIYKGTADVPNDFPSTPFKERFDFLSEDDSIRYAMGWFVAGNKAFHTGSWLGTRTFVYRDLESPLTFMVFANHNIKLAPIINKAYHLIQAKIN